jgi:hypothetical protein
VNFVVAPRTVVDLALSGLTGGCATALAVLSLRAFPVTAALFAGPCAVWQKVVALSGYAATTSLATRYAGFHGRELLVAYAALLAISTASFAISRLCAGALLMPVTLALFFVAPAIWMHGNGFGMLLGWEMGLSAYSYCVDAPAPSRSFGDYIFFVFVNPTIAYPRRGSRVDVPGLSRAGLWRVTQGAFVLVASGAIVPVLVASGPLESGVVSRVLFGVARSVSLYGACWGLGSVQVGLFRQLGYEAPERYRQPYRATTPRDFWARWNTYVGAWVRFYLFEPFVRLLRARSGARSVPRATSRAWVRAAAITISFVGIGALHDLYATLVHREITVATTLWFAANALAILAWDVVSRSAWRRESWTARVATSVAMVGLMIGFAVALP